MFALVLSHSLLHLSLSLFYVTCQYGPLIESILAIYAMPPDAGYKAVN